MHHIRGKEEKEERMDRLQPSTYSRTRLSEEEDLVGELANYLEGGGGAESLSVAT